MNHKRIPRWLPGAMAAVAVLVCTTSHATEGASGAYTLGGHSLNAGVSPPPGWYLTVLPIHYGGLVGGALQGGVTVLQLHKQVDTLALNMLYAPRRKVFGGQLGLIASVPYVYVRLRGEASNGAQDIHRAVSGSGVGDMTLGAQLGWKVTPSLHHLVALLVWTPTGDYQAGFNPSFSHHRWAADALWAVTYSPASVPIEVSGAIGYGINAPNPVTHYRSGNEAHLELAAGYRLPPHWELGVASYTSRQLSADSGRGARLGSLEGRVSAVGPALNYTTLVGKHGFVATARYYREFDAKRHFRGSLALMSFTMRL